jgi:hypothetical protein
LAASFFSGRFPPRRPFGDVHPAEPESFCNGTPHGSFAVQNHIYENAINAVALRKSGLTSFTFNCGSQQANNVILVKLLARPMRRLAWLIL